LTQNLARSGTRTRPAAVCGWLARRARPQAGRQAMRDSGGKPMESLERFASRISHHLTRASRERRGSRPEPARYSSAVCVLLCFLWLDMRLSLPLRPFHFREIVPRIRVVWLNCECGLEVLDGLERPPETNEDHAQIVVHFRVSWIGAERLPVLIGGLLQT